VDYGGDPGFESVRTTLESALALPFAVAITSSQAGDGKTHLAVGLARTFARAGFETIVVDANPLAPAVGTALGLANLAPPKTLAPGDLSIMKAGGLLEATSIASHRLADDATDAQLRGLVQYLRGKYRVTILDLCEVFYGPFAVLSAAACDGVVLTIRYARNADPEDDKVVGTLEQMGARIIGSVPTSCPA